MLGMVTATRIITTITTVTNKRFFSEGLVSVFKRLSGYGGLFLWGLI